MGFQRLLSTNSCRNKWDTNIDFTNNLVHTYSAPHILVKLVYVTFTIHYVFYHVVIYK